MRYAIFTILALSLFVVACGGAPSDTTGTTPTESVPTETATSVAAPAKPLPPETKPVATKDASDEFEDAITAYMGGQFFVEYSMTSSADGETATGTMSQYFGGTNRMRTDSTSEGITSRFYLVNDELVTCFTYDGEWQCNKLPEGEKNDETETGDLTDYADDGDNVEYTVVRDGTMKVAGVTAECYKITEEQGLSRYCLYDSIPLYVKSEYDGGMSELTATKYRKSVSASDFTYPATPTEGFDLGGGAAGALPDGYEMPDGFDASAFQ